LDLIRRFFPKKTELKFDNENRIGEIEKMINHRRVRKFGYIRPIEKLKTTCPLAFITYNGTIFV